MSLVISYPKIISFRKSRFYIKIINFKVKIICYIKIIYYLDITMLILFELYFILLPF